MQTLLQDLRYGARMLFKRPGFTLVALITLALGVGANTAIFSIVYGVLLRPLPYAESERLTMVWLRGVKEAGGDHTPLSVADLLDWRAKSHSFEQVGAFGFNRYNYTGGQVPEEITGTSVTANFFDTLGMRPLLGRTFLPGEEQPGAARAVVVSEAFWRKRLGANPQAIERAINLSGTSYTVVGVMPQSFAFPGPETELWAAMQLAPPSRRGPYYLTGLARLAPGVTLEQARSEMQGVAGQISGKEVAPDEGFNVMPLTEVIVGRVSLALWVLFAAVILVLLIASVNVANLQLARATARDREFSIRTALGASRLRLVRQLLTESMLLAVCGGLVGLLLAVWGVDLLLALGKDQVPRLNEIGVDWRVFGWAMLVAMASGLIFGLAPALQSSKANLNEALKEGGRGSTEGAGRRRLRDSLVVVEVALALALLVGAGLLLKSFWRLQNVETGVHAQQIFTGRVSLVTPKYAERDQRREFYRQLLERLKTTPGVQSVALTSGLPPDRLGLSDGFGIEGQPDPPDGKGPVADLLMVSPAYFETLGIPILQGRDFNEADKQGAPVVAIINQTLARKFFPDENPVGRRLRYGGPVEIVGVVGDVKYRGLGDEVAPAIYLSLQQTPFFAVFVTARAGVADPLSLTSAIRAEVNELDTDLAVADPNTMERLMYESVGDVRLRTALIAAFAALAVLLAGVGIYGVMSYSVTQRTHELGVRLALGAQTGDVMRLVLRQGMRVILIGVGLGLAAALALTRLLESLLFNVSTADPATFVVITLLLAGIALLACYLPARRATKVDPMIALRYE
ncbi:MAG TPA: ABC transporter permease [Blastocatellia bacterium]|nr:ABC transporter permease [Blastocatellia bacterium]